MSDWICTVCGYVHQGAAPPESCQICGATAEYFERLEPPRPASPPAGPRRWRCLNCDYIQEGDGPPDSCLICGVGPEQFEAVVAGPADAGGSALTGTILVIGGGIAGLSAAEAARQGAPQASVLLLTKEQDLPYYRLNLTRYLAGELEVQALTVHPRSWYAEHGIDIRFGSEVTAIDPARKIVSLKEAAEVSYDRLILAMGAHSFVPPIPGVNLKNIVTLRTRRDADRILERSAGSSCVIVGGGVLGLETAAALARRGVRVTLVEGFSWLLPRQLNRKAGERLAAVASRQGINLVADARIKLFDGDEEVRSVVLESGDVLPADLVVVTAGVRSNSYLARLAGLEVRAGVVVDQQLRTSDPDIYAAGDLIEHQGVTYGAWSPAQFQGSIAGKNAAGGELLFAGVPRANSLKVLDIDMFSIGQVHPDDASYQYLEDGSERNYRLLVFRDSRLVGAILLGDTSLAPQIKKLIEAKTSCAGLLAGDKDNNSITQGILAL